MAYDEITALLGGWEASRSCGCDGRRRGERVPEPLRHQQRERGDLGLGMGKACHGILLVGGTLDDGPNGMGRGK